MFGAWVRRAGFWILDGLQGGAKRNIYNDIKHNGDRHTEEKIARLLQHAKEHVPFYKDIAGDTLYEFPVMNKLRYREKDSATYLADMYVGRDLHTVYTSGSTGTPFKVVQNAGKRNRTIIDLIYCHDSLGWKLGDKYVFIRNWVSNYKQSVLKSLMQNSYNVNITGFNDEQKSILTHWLRRHKNVVILGYASALNEYAVYLQEQGIDGRELQIKLLVSDSDALTSSIRHRLTTVFGCPVCNRYDNEENGLLGISAPNEECIYLNTASLFFEILNVDNDQPAESGTIGRVVVTDLYNYAMPLIRYDTGDLAVSNDDPKQIKTLEALYGRVAGHLTNTQGRLVSDVAISGAMEPFTGIVKYQIVQRENKVYNIRYVGCLTEEEKQDIMQRMYSCFGIDAIVQLENTDDIPVGKNGKYKTTINETLV